MADSATSRTLAQAGWRGFLARHERAAFAALLMIGLMERIIWVSQHGRIKMVVDETEQVASCFARTGHLCDAYFAGQGPTAHVNPVLPVWGGLVYRAFGLGSVTSEVVLTAASLAVFSATLLALYLAFRRLAVSIEWRLIALATALLLPMNFKWETVSMRLFEGGVAAALLAFGLLLVLRLDDRGEPLGARDFALPAGLVGLLALINPPAALGAYGAFGVLVLKRVPIRRWISVALVMILGLMVFITPWGIRNEHVFGRLILARSNFPLEHALGFHEAAVDPADPAAVFRARAMAIHPFSDNPKAPGHLEVERLGELGYMDKLAAENHAWERGHRADVVRISLRHLGEFWLPPKWLWRIFSNTAPMVPLSQALVWTITLASFAAIGWRLIKVPLGSGLYLACALLIPSIPYALVQPIQRYRYLIVVLTFFLAADFLDQLSKAIRSRWHVQR